jgi:hypothetical protein
VSAAESFTAFLVADMEATGSTAFAESLLTKAKIAIEAGNGQLGFMTSGSVNGKTFGRTKELSALDIAKACRDALDLYADNETPLITYPNYGKAFFQP